MLIKSLSEKGLGFTAVLLLLTLGLHAQCPPQQLPFHEDFDNGLGCFSVTVGGSSNDSWAHTSNMGGTTPSPLNYTPHVLVNSDHAGQGVTMNEELTSAVIDAGNIAGGLFLEFDHHFDHAVFADDTGYVEVFDGTTWHEVAQYYNTTGFFFNVDHPIIDITPYANSTLLIRFRYRDFGGRGKYWLIDNIEVTDVPCVPSSKFDHEYIRHDSVALSWRAGTAAGHHVLYGPQGFPLSSGTRVSVSRDSLGIDGLNPATDYDFYLLDSCSGSFEDTLGPLSIRTHCAPLPLPYSQDFDNGKGCFSIEVGGNTPDSWGHTPAGGMNSIQGDINGTPFMSVSSLDAGGNSNIHLREKLLSPLLDASPYTNGSLILSYLQYYRHRGFAGWDSVTVEVFDGSDWVIVDYYPDSTLGGYNSPDSVSMNLSQYANPHFQVRFVYDDQSNLSRYWLIDNFRIESFPCGSTYSLDTSNVDSTSVELQWNSPHGSMWNIQWGPPGFSPYNSSGTTIPAVSNNPYSLTGLDPMTCYDYYVQDTCAGVGAGPWGGPFRFCTKAVCDTPLTTTLSAVDSTQATLDWTGGGDHQVSLVSGTQSGPLAGNITTLSGQNSFTATGLSSVTDYCLYLRKVCRPGDTSAWVGPYCFTTDCPPPYNLPFAEDFSGKSAQCWRSQPVNGLEQWGLYSGDSSGVISSAYTGSLNAILHTTSSTFNMPKITRFLSPPINASDPEMKELSFYYAQSELPFVKNYSHLYYRDSINDPWKMIWSDSSNVEQWTRAEVVIPSVSPRLQIAFEGIDNGASPVVIDQVEIDTTSEGCSMPTNVHASSSDCRSFQLDWHSSTGGSLVEIGPPGFTPGNGTSTGAVSPPHLFTGLQLSTSYDIYIADTCGSSDTSRLMGPFTFATDDDSIPSAQFTASANPDSLLEYSFDASVSTGAIQRYLWDFGDGNTDEGQQVTHRYAQTGNYQVRLITTSHCIADTAMETLANVALADYRSTAIHLYPNPVSQQLTLEWEGEEDDRLQIRILEISGKVVQTGVWATGEEGKHRMDVSALAAGVYYLELQGREGPRQFRRFVVE